MTRDDATKIAEAFALCQYATQNNTQNHNGVLLAAMMVSEVVCADGKMSREMFAGLAAIPQKTKSTTFRGRRLASVSLEDRVSDILSSRAK